ncbi:MAG: hypothetical protein Q8R94_25960 [Phenylobacterium sp.]|nr:hypothetical protein [Phenylobacterium sp.]
MSYELETSRARGWMADAAAQPSGGGPSRLLRGSPLLQGPDVLEAPGLAAQKSVLEMLRLASPA